MVLTLYILEQRETGNSENIAAAIIVPVIAVLSVVVVVIVVVAILAGTKRKVIYRRLSGKKRFNMFIGINHSRPREDSEICKNNHQV